MKFKQKKKGTSETSLFCTKCGNKLLYDSVFCEMCGKKNKKTKKSFKRIVSIIAICVATLLVIALLIWGYDEYTYKIASYDLETLPYSLGSYRDDYYVYQIKDTDGNLLSDIWYLEDNYYIRSICHGDVFYIYEKGIYEISGKKLITRNQSGEETKYLIYSNCIIKDNKVYEGEVPNDNKFTAVFKRNYSDILEVVRFNDDGTYIREDEFAEYNGKYTRNGCVISGISQDINGSGKWLVYKGQLISNFYICDYPESGYAKRTKYEFYKYLSDVAPDKIGMSERQFISGYEASHPISLNK